ncbi:hypothetical protein Hanom_Chr14g01254591 [Helianthus anomalus]
MVAGIVPLKKFFMIRIFVNDLQFPMVSGNGPKKKFSISINTSNFPVVNEKSQIRMHI